MKKLLLSYFVFACISFCKAQLPILHQSSNTTIYNKTWENDTSGLLWWHCDSMLSGQLFTTYKSFTGLTANDSMHRISIEDDPFVCLKHSRYQQYHKGILVQAAEFREHYTNEYVILSNGTIAEELDLPTTPLISESLALSSALEYVGAETYAWEDDSIEYYLQEDSIPGFTTYYPEGTLVYALTGDKKIKASNYKLSWRFYVRAIVPNDVTKIVYVDAITGTILKEEPCERTGTFTHVFYGNKYPDTRYEWGRYYLYANDVSGKNIKTKDANWENSWRVAALPSDNDDNWGTDHWAATSAHYVVSNAFDWFRIFGNWSGLDGKGKELRIYADYNYDGQNAAFRSDWSSHYDYMQFGRGSLNSGIYYPATYDVGGHEYSHGVGKYVNGLLYEDESGALDESFADIFGFLSERYAEPTTWDWTIGEDFVCPQLRDMELPSSVAFPTPGTSCNYPSTYPIYYQDGNWNTYPIECDFGGVHINSSVQNRWFYLLSMGGTQLGKTVQGIGINKAALITYFSFMFLVQPTETYVQARKHAVAAARLLYGPCSFEESQTCRAWSACNIGPYCDCLEEPICWNYGCPEETKKNTSIHKISNEEAVDIVLYPNPSKDEIIVDFKEFTMKQFSEISPQIELLDVNGRILKSILVNNELQYPINVSDLRDGMYVIRVFGNEYNKSFKFIKK
ncbi:MAG: M4 family metallopeptidase [Bacteroidia bacterium]|nr:M4 family metallopeptidase [Bacteroidia bacterium]MBP7262178.1 M4 family metallopeptidase [Bacteroidia bacterium]MBP9181380.1 M4 family metallopeptidase [Bacteroidia bacterium]MBP9725669.1 M4 family metallopeptidase [Bacteroidia bacterium]